MIQVVSSSLCKDDTEGYNASGSSAMQKAEECWLVQLNNFKQYTDQRSPIPVTTQYTTYKSTCNILRLQ